MWHTNRAPILKKPFFLRRFDPSVVLYIENSFRSKNQDMRKFESIQVAKKKEREEIKKIFDYQTKLLIGILVFAIMQYVFLLIIIQS